MPKPQCKLSLEQQNQVVELYLKGKTVAELNKQFGYAPRNHHGILKILKKNNISIRLDNKTHAKRYSLNENYFEKIDSERKAYWLGLMYADGYNGQKKRYIRLQLVESEKYILEEFAKDLETTQPLKYLNKSNKNPKHQDFYILNIYNGKICDDLAKLGCGQAKSLILTFPTEDIVPKQFIRHFIRGFFDGDGSVYISNKQTGVAFTSTTHLIMGIQEVLKNELGFTPTKLTKRHKDQDNDCYDFRFCGNKKAKIFKKWLYEDATVYFTRKYDKFQ